MCLINALTSFRVSQCAAPTSSPCDLAISSAIQSMANSLSCHTPHATPGQTAQIAVVLEKIICSLGKKTWKGPNICDSHLLDSSLASFLGGTMVYRNTEKVILLLPGKPHPARRLLAIFHGRHLTRTPFKSWALKQPATISYTFSNIRSAWDDLITSQTVHLPCGSLRLGCVHRNAWRAPEAPPVP